MASATQQHRLEVLDEVERLRACEVRVFWLSDDWLPGHVGCVQQWLDDGAWVVYLNTAYRDADHRDVLRSAWGVMLDPLSEPFWDVQPGVRDDPERPPYRAVSFLAEQ